MVASRGFPFVMLIALAATARADDGRAAYVELPAGYEATEVVPLGDVLWLLAATKEDEGPRLLAWDPAAKAIAAEVTLPKHPAGLALVHGKLVVACRESGVVAIVDPVERRVARTVATAVGAEALWPLRVLPDGPPGRAVVLCTRPDSWDAEWALEVDLERGTVAPLLRRTFARRWGNAAFCGEHVLVQEQLSRGFGAPVFHRLGELRAATGETPKARSAYSSYEYGRGTSVNDRAAFLFGEVTNEGDSTIAVSPDGRELWRAVGELLAVHPTQPVAVVLRAPRNSASTNAWPLVGLHTGNGRELWQRTVRTRKEIGRYPRACVIVPGAPDRLLAYLDAHRREEWAPTDLTWLSMALPASQAVAAPSLTNRPPLELQAGVAFTFVPEVGNRPAGSTFALERGPEGMTVDAATGRTAWTPGRGVAVRHDVTLALVVAGERTPLASFTLVVRGARPVGAGPVEPERIAVGERPIEDVLPAPDGARWFLFERAHGAVDDGALLVLDPATSAISPVRLSQGACHVALAGERAAVACRASQVVVLVDAATAKVARAFEVGDGRYPVRVSRHAAAGKLVVACADRDRLPPGRLELVELDLASGAVTLLTPMATVPELVVAGDVALLQNAAGGSPDAFDLARLRRGEAHQARLELDAWREFDGPPLVVVDGGRHLLGGTRGSRPTTCLLRPDGSAVWRVPGQLLAAHPARGLAITLPPLLERAQDPRRAERETTVLGRDLKDGRVLFRAHVQHVDRHDALRDDGRATLVSGPAGDVLLFQGKTWWRVLLPAPGPTATLEVAAEPSPPQMARTGERLVFAPAVSGAPTGTTFVLRRGPAGMTVDPASGRVEWTPPADAGDGPHAVEVVARVGEDEVSLVTFELRVLPGRRR